MVELTIASPIEIQPRYVIDESLLHSDPSDSKDEAAQRAIDRGGELDAGVLQMRLLQFFGPTDLQEAWPRQGDSDVDAMIFAPSVRVPACTASVLDPSAVRPFAFRFISVLPARRAMRPMRYSFVEQRLTDGEIRNGCTVPDTYTPYVTAICITREDPQDPGTPDENCADLEPDYHC